MTEANTAFDIFNVALVSGDNDARKPWLACPILPVVPALPIVVVKRSMNPGCAGTPDALFIDPKTGTYFADATQALSEILAATKTAATKTSVTD